jgi:hypothetical protein
VLLCGSKHTLQASVGGVVMAVAWLQEWLQMDGQGWYCIQSAALRAEHRKGKKRPAVACSTAAVAAAGSF